LLLTISGFGFALVVSFVAGVVVNQLVEAAAYKRAVFHPPEIGVVPWITSFLVVGTSIWAASLIGMVLGRLVAAATGLTWLGWIITAACTFALVPVGILSAYYNGSPIQLLSPTVIRTMATHRDGWLRFYKWMAIWLGLSILVSTFSYVPGVGGVLLSFSMAAIVVLVGRTIGLLAQAFIINWVED
jgi:hypothetical protein